RRAPNSTSLELGRTKHQTKDFRHGWIDRRPRLREHPEPLTASLQCLILSRRLVRRPIPRLILSHHRRARLHLVRRCLAIGPGLIDRLAFYCHTFFQLFAEDRSGSRRRVSLKQQRDRSIHQHSLLDLCRARRHAIYVNGRSGNPVSAQRETKVETLEESPCVYPLLGPVRIPGRSLILIQRLPHLGYKRRELRRLASVSAKRSNRRRSQF